MTTQIDALFASLVLHGFDVRTWRNERIYFGRYNPELSLFIEFDNPSRQVDRNATLGELLHGAKIVSHAAGRLARRWMVRKAETAKRNLMLAMASAGFPVDQFSTWQEVTL